MVVSRCNRIGELELTTNFLDPIFSLLFHHPTINKHFIWLNRQDENTGGLRPDGVMISVPKKKSRKHNLRVLWSKSAGCRSKFRVGVCWFGQVVNFFPWSDVKKRKQKSYLDTGNWLYSYYLLNWRGFPGCHNYVWNLIVWCTTNLIVHGKEQRQCICLKWEEGMLILKAIAVFYILHSSTYDLINEINTCGGTALRGNSQRKANDDSKTLVS